MRPGRTCPLSYSYPAAALRRDRATQADTLWVAGGLYGNVPALEALLVLLRYDASSWRRRFLQAWPPGSHAHASYWKRICEGPSYTLDDAVRLRPGVSEPAA